MSSIYEILKDLKGKALDVATIDLLQKNYELQEETNSQLRENVEAIKLARDLQAEKIVGLESEIDRLSAENDELREEIGAQGVNPYEDLTPTEDEGDIKVRLRRWFISHRPAIVEYAVVDDLLKIRSGATKRLIVAIAETQGQVPAEQGGTSICFKPKPRTARRSSYVRAW